MDLGKNNELGAGLVQFSPFQYITPAHKLTLTPPQSRPSATAAPHANTNVLQEPALP